jgi:NTE family protein
MPKAPSPAKVKINKNKPPRLGLALSGGASRGIAHVGVLKALQDNNIKIDSLSGTSIGAMVAALYAFGISLEDIHRQALEMSWLKISSLRFSRTALLSNKVIGEIIENFIGDATIESSPIPLAIVTTDIATGKKVVLRKGNIARAVMASSAIPGIFAPLRIDGRLLVDGFLVENVPISPLREMEADVIVAVSLSTLKAYREPNRIINILMNAFDIAIDYSTILSSQNADVMITPGLSGIPAAESEESHLLFDEGYKSALLAIPQIQNALQAQRMKGQTTLWERVRKILNPEIRTT